MKVWPQIINEEGRRVLLFLARFRAASSAQLHALLGSEKDERTTGRLLHDLKTSGLIRTVALPHRRVAYTITAGATRAVDFLEERLPTRSLDGLTIDGAIAGWQRAALWVALRNDGYTVGCDYDAFLAVVNAYRTRLKAVDAQAREAFSNVLRPLMRNLPSRNPWRCGRCGFVASERLESHTSTKQNSACKGRLYLNDYLLYDVAYRDGELVFLVVDNPNRNIRTQLEELPVRVAARVPGSATVAYLPPRFPVIFVPSQDGSLWAPDDASWVARGVRLKRWHGYILGQSRTIFPYWKVLECRDPPSAAVFATVAQRASYAYGLSFGDASRTESDQ